MPNLLYVIPPLVACGVAVLLVRSLLHKQRDRNRGWRVGHVGRDAMFYEEFADGVWQRIHVEGEMLMEKAHHVIYFGSLELPDWAKPRRNEIIARIKSEFRPPAYEYNDG